MMVQYPLLLNLFFKIVYTFYSRELISTQLKVLRVTRDSSEGMIEMRYILLNDAKEKELKKVDEGAFIVEESRNAWGLA